MASQPQRGGMGERVRRARRAGTLAFMVATETTSLGIAGVLASLYPAITVLLAAIVLGERIDTGQRMGIGICTLAVTTLALA